MTAPRRLSELLLEHPAAPDAVLVHDADGDTTRAAIDALVDALAAALSAAGVEGRRIGVSLPNRASAIATWFAVWRIGATVVPLNPRVPPAELERLMQAASVEAVVTVADDADRFPPSFRRVADAPALVLRGPRLVDDDDGDAPAIVQFTSGTSGPPKAVPLTHGSILALLDPVIATLRGKGERKASPMPNLIPVSLSLWAGIYNVLFAFRVGAPVVLMDRFDPPVFAELVRRYGIASSVLPPAAMVMLTEDERVESLEPLRYIRSVTSPLSPYQARRFFDRFGVGVLNGYGQTELGGEVVGWSAADWRSVGEAKLGAVGRPHPGVELRVRDGAGTVLGPDEVGELEVRTASTVADPSPALADRITDDGWVRTGDLAHIDADGFVWIDGRVSAMINRGGLKIFPDEVEEVLRSDADVVDACLVGVPDDRLGERPVAFVVTRSGADADPAALEARCRADLAPYKIPTEIRTIAELPRNEVGKVLRSRLVELVGAQSAQERR